MTDNIVKFKIDLLFFRNLIKSFSNFISNSTFCIYFTKKKISITEYFDNTTGIIYISINTCELYNYNLFCDDFSACIDLTQLLNLLERGKKDDILEVIFFQEKLLLQYTDNENKYLVNYKINTSPQIELKNCKSIIKSTIHSNKFSKILNILKTGSLCAIKSSKTELVFISDYKEYPFIKSKNCDDFNNTQDDYETNLSMIYEINDTEIVYELKIDTETVKKISTFKFLQFCNELSIYVNDKHIFIECFLTRYGRMILDIGSIVK